MIQSKVWGTSVRLYSLEDYQKIREARLLDIEIIKLMPTWRNNRVGEVGISKRLDRFLIPKYL